MNQPGGQAGRRHGWRLLIVVLAMFGFGFALGPMYTAICKATGINGKFSGEQTDPSKIMAVDTSRTVKVIFLTTVNGGRFGEFRAEQSTIDVHPGQPATVNFFFRNTGDQDIVAQAVPNIAPWDAAKHLKKTECFCFRQQAFKAGEGRDMPVRFLLDPGLPADVDTVTLSYTFFDVTQTAHRAEPVRDTSKAS